MDNDRINLLPPERQRALSREYALRLVTVAALLLTALTLCAAILLAPTYVFLAKSAVAKKEQLSSIESAFSTADEKALSAHLAALASGTALLAALARSPSASATVREALAVPHPGVALTGLAYTAAAGKARGTLAISGAAATRDALRRYQIALEGAPFAASADLPVSAYAKEADISFTITLTLAP